MDSTPARPLVPISPDAPPVVGSAAADVVAASAAAGSAVMVSAGGMSFNLEFDAAAMAAPASFRAGIEQAATLLSQSITDKVTVNLKIDCSGTGGGASASPVGGLFASYSTVCADLVAKASPGDSRFASLPSGTSIQGQTQVAVWNAELKALGLIAANDLTTDDGLATFATDIAQGNLVGVALHEFTHALGRTPYDPQPDVFDLFRFTAAGTRLYTTAIPAPAAYFSVDGGATKLADYATVSDPSDFLNEGVQGSTDPLNAYYDSSTVGLLSNVDLAQLDVLGFHVVAPSAFSAGLASDTGSSGSDSLTRDPTVSGTAIAFKTVVLSENGAYLGTTTANAVGSWSFKPTISDGRHSIVATSVDALGQSTSATASFWLSTQAPTTSAYETVSGATQLTSDVVSVAAAAEAVGPNSVASAEVYDGSSDLGAATLASPGVWRFTAQKLLAGVHTLSAKVTDAAGNVSTATLAPISVIAPPPSAAYSCADFSVPGSGITDVRAKDINNHGEVVGYYIDGRADDKGADGQTYYEHGFASTLSGTSRSYVTIGDPDAPLDHAVGNDNGLDRSRAFAVNDAGDVVGWYSQDQTGKSSAGNTYVLPDAGFIDSASWPSTFGTLGYNQLNDLGTHALGINASDEIVGYYLDGSGLEHGFVRSFTGYGARGDYVSIDVPGARNTVVEGVDDAGSIAGFFQTSDGAFHGFVEAGIGGAITPIDVNGATTTELLGINNQGQVVGYYLDSAGARHGFVRNANGRFVTVDDPNAGSGGTLVGGINDSGQIVGWYTGSDGHDHGFVGTALSSRTGQDGLTISGAPGAAKVASSATSFSPFPSVSISDAVAGASVTANVTPHGFSDTALGLPSNVRAEVAGKLSIVDPNAAANGSSVDSSGVYTVTGSAAAVTAALQGLQAVVPSAGAISEATFSIFASDAGGSTASDASTDFAFAAPVAPITPGAVYRFFDSIHGTHFLTSSASERDAVKATRPDLVEEVNNFGTAAPTDPGDVTVYRFFDDVYGTHFFTSSQAEHDTLLATRPDLVAEPSASFLEHGTQQAGDVAVYRFFDTNNGTHFYTGDAKEEAGLVTAGSASYRPDLKLEGVSFYAPSGSFI